MIGDRGHIITLLTLGVTAVFAFAPLTAHGLWRLQRGATAKNWRGRQRGKAVEVREKLMLTLLAAVEFSAAFGLGQGFRAAKDTGAAVSLQLSQPRGVADPFLAFHATFMSCDSSSTSDCHRQQSVVAGIRIHPVEAAWLGFDFAAGLGRITALSGPLPDNSPPTHPANGDIIPLLGVGPDLRFAVGTHAFVRVEVIASLWPSWPFKSLSEVDYLAGLGVNF